MNKQFRKLAAITLAAAMAGSLMPSSLMTAKAAEPFHSKTVNDNLLRIWYDKPASDWQTEALAIGNGYMGGLVYGGISEDKIHLNEKTVWDGGPTADNQNGYNYGNTNPTETEEDLQKVQDSLNTIRNKLEDKSKYVFGYDEKTYASVGTGTSGEAMNDLNKLMGDLKGYDAPRDYASIYIDTHNIDESQVTGYVRDLDLRTALATVSYDYDGVHYTREYFNSYPDNVLVVRLSADKKGKIDFDTRLQAVFSSNASNTAKEDTITMRGALQSNGLMTEAQLKVIPEGGSVSANGSSLSVSGADSATLILSCGTDYKMELPTFRGEDPHQAVTDRINSAAEKGYRELKADHVADHSALFSRLDIGFNEEIPQIPTDELIRKYRNLTDGNGGEIPTEAEQRALEIICYQFGRYLTIAGSREGSLPTNLQGVWGEGGFTWYGDYHFNINVQMNYWPTLAGNLAECQIPYNDFLNVLRQAGKNAVEASFGIENASGENGWLVGCFSTPYMFASMGQKGNAAGWNPIGSAWALLNSYEYYLYTGDTDYLKNELYPSMKSVANFWDKALIWSENQQRYVSSPSYSPENGPIVSGASYDQQFIWQHFENTIAAAETLGVDQDLIAKWKEKQSKLEPVIVGKDGQVKEWFEETTFGKAQAGGLPEIDIPQWRVSLGAGSSGQEPPHRHLSHLMALYPCNIISKDNSDYMDAAIVTLNERGLDATGWSKAHKLNLWARTGHSEEAFKLVQSAVGGGNSGFLTNLFSSHGGGANYKAYPIFQIDGNFGYTAGINEMLLQSQLGYVQFLPTLPKEWNTGFINGIVARNNFVIDMKWSEGTADKFTITSRNGGTFTGEYAGLSKFEVRKSDGTSVKTEKLSDDKISFDTEKGETYTIDFTEDSSKLENQISAAKELAASMNAEILATAKSVLEEKITSAESVIAAGESGKFEEHRTDLISACRTAQAAISLSDSLDVLQKLYDARDIKEIWPKYIELIREMETQIDAAKKILSDTSATADAFKTVESAVSAVAKKAEGFSDSLKISFSPEKGMVEAGQKIELSSEYDDLTIRYTTDGNDPVWFSDKYTEPIEPVNNKTTIKAALFSGTRRIGSVFSSTYLYGEKGNNVSIKASASTDNVYGGTPQYSGASAIDGNTETRWATSDGTNAVILELTFSEAVTVDSATIKQYYDPAANDIRDFNIEYWDGENWNTALAHGSMNQTAEKLFFFDKAISAEKIRLNILDGTNPSIYEFELHESAPGTEYDTNKDGLQFFLKKAEEAISSGEVEQAVESVQKSFMEIYDYAKSVNDNRESSQTTVDKTMTALITELQKLGFIAGDKEELQQHYEKWKNIDLDLYLDGPEKDAFKAALDEAFSVLMDTDAMPEDIKAADQKLLNAAEQLLIKPDKTLLKTLTDLGETYNQDDYVPAGWEDFIHALDNAKTILSDESATKIQVEEAEEALMNAMSALRYKADKSLLQEVLGRAEKIQTDGYTPSSIEAFNSVLKQAKTIFEDEGLSKEDQYIVDQAAADLEHAINGLQKESSDPDKTEKPDSPAAGTESTPAHFDNSKTSSVNTEQSDSTRKPVTSGKKSVQTGDTAPVGEIAAILILSAAVAVSTVLIKKKKH